MVVLLAACSSSSPKPTSRLSNPSPTVTPSLPDATPTATPSTTPSPAPTGGGVYAATVSGKLAPGLTGLAPRVYVPNEQSGDVTVIDPVTYK